MLCSVYTKNTEDNQDFDVNAIDLTDSLQCYMQQIANVFSTEVGEVMGAADMTTNLDEMVYEMNASNKAISKNILNVIQRYCTLCQDFTTKVYVKFAQGKKRDICFIDIIVDNKYKLTMKLQ